LNKSGTLDFLETQQKQFPHSPKSNKNKNQSSIDVIPDLGTEAEETHQSDKQAVSIELPNDRKSKTPKKIKSIIKLHPTETDENLEEDKNNNLNLKSPKNSPKKHSPQNGPRLTKLASDTLISSTKYNQEDGILTPQTKKSIDKYERYQSLPDNASSSDSPNAKTLEEWKAEFSPKKVNSVNQMVEEIPNNNNGSVPEINEPQSAKPQNKRLLFKNSTYKIRTKPVENFGATGIRINTDHATDSPSFRHAPDSLALNSNRINSLRQNAAVEASHDSQSQRSTGNTPKKSNPSSRRNPSMIRGKTDGNLLKVNTTKETTPTFSKKSNFAFKNNNNGAKKKKRRSDSDSEDDSSPSYSSYSDLSPTSKNAVSSIITSTVEELKDEDENATPSHKKNVANSKMKKTGSAQKINIQK